MKTKQTALAIAVAVATALAAGYSAPALSASPSDTLVVGKIGDFTTFDPWTVLDSNAIMHHQLFNPLVFASAPGVFSPELAESWEFSADNSSVTFHLRDGVTFHNGRPMAADDVIANIDRARDATIGHGLSGQAKIITGATALDATTVAVAFVSAVPQQVALDLFSSMFIIAPEAFADVESSPVGTGPFMLEEWLPGERATFKRYEGYWKQGLPKMEEVSIRSYSDPAAMRIAYDNSEIDIIQRAPTSDAPYYRRKAGTTLIESTRAGGFWDLVVNVTEPPFDDVRVRQALAHAVDRDAIVQNVLFGVGEVIQTPFHNKGLAIYNPEQTTRYPFDLDKAKALLAEAGQENLAFTMTAFGGSPATLGTAQIVQADLKKIGVDVQISNLENAIALPKWLSGDFEVFSGSSAVLPRDLSATFSIVAPFKADGNSNASYTDQRYLDAAAAAAVSTDADERTRLYSELRDIVVDQSFVISIATSPWLYVVRDGVEGLNWSAAFDYLILEQASKAAN